MAYKIYFTIKFQSPRVHKATWDISSAPPASLTSPTRSGPGRAGRRACHVLPWPCATSGRVRGCLSVSDSSVICWLAAVLPAGGPYAAGAVGWSTQECAGGGSVTRV